MLLCRALQRVVDVHAHIQSLTIAPFDLSLHSATTSQTLQREPAARARVWLLGALPMSCTHSATDGQPILTVGDQVMQSDRSISRGQYTFRRTAAEAGLLWCGTNLNNLTSLPERLLTSADIESWDEVKPNTAGEIFTCFSAMPACAAAFSDTRMYGGVLVLSRMHTRVVA